MSIIYFIVMIGVLIFVHELGHFVAARKFGVHVKQFAIGMGPKITGFIRKGTDFRIGILPLGGYVLMAENREEATHGEPLPGVAVWKRAVIAAAGPAFSLGFPILCYFLIALSSAEVPAPVIGQVAEESPAAEAGIQPGDEILAVNGTEITYFRELQSAIADSEGALELLVLRSGEELTLNAEPADSGSPGVPPRLGISVHPTEEAAEAGAEVVMVEFPLSERLPYAMGHSVTEPIVVSGRIVSMLGGFITGETSTKELGGPIMIYDVSRRAGNAGWRVFLEVMAVISINLGLINLLPIPVLDGGRLMLLGVEAIQRRPLSARAQQITAMVGVAMVIGLMVLAFKNDIERYWDGLM